MKENSIIVTANTLESALVKGATYFKIDVNNCGYSIVSSNKNEIKVKIWDNSKKEETENYKKDLSFEEKITNLDGYFKIEYIDGYATLSVFPPKDKGRPVYVEDVINRIRLLNIPSVDPNLIMAIIKRAKGSPEKLVLWPEGREYRATIEVIVSDDKMSASIIMFPPKKGGGNLTVDEIIKILNNKGIIYGINYTLIEDIVNNNIFKKEIEIARGKEPKPGKPSNIKYFFDTEPGKPFLVDQYDRINYKELNFVQNKKKGDILAELLDPIPGEVGFNIFGQRLEIPQIENNRLFAGENTTLSDDNKKIIATIDGNVKIKNGKIVIEPLLELENMDYSTGNIDFHGDVFIKGGILDGFSVKSDGIIQVGGPIGKVTIVARGDIILKGGMNGGNEGILETDGNIYARYLEGVIIRSCKSLFVEEAIMNCYINVEKNLILNGKRGEILGGTSIVGGSVRCKKIGNPFGIKTILRIGVEPKIINLISDFDKKIKEKRELLKVIEDRYLSYSKMLEEDRNNLTIVEKHKNLLEALERLKDEIHSMEREFKEANSMLVPKEKRYVVVENTMHSSTFIYFGKEEYSTQKDISRIMLKYIGNRIIESGFASEKEIPQFED
ncbi:MAG TPA: FapA family protein [Spirochaetota bacterium]|nr:FapA family protein [Spirochaetota bacterium]